MIEYHKIPAIFERDYDGTKLLIEGKFRNEAVEFIKDLEWVFTEKIDGTNIRVHWNGHNVEFASRTDKAIIPYGVVKCLEDKFGGNVNEEIFEQKFGENDVILFGEGYGHKIQKYGDLYRIDNSFILFDVLVGNTWLKREDVEDIAKTFNIEVVPIVGTGTIDDAVKFIKAQPDSTIGTAKMEGIVARPKIELRDRLGNRLIVKIKVCDFV